MAYARAGDMLSEVDAVASTAIYRAFLETLKQRIHESRARALQAVNSELVMLYWSIGREIVEQQRLSGWGDDIVGRIAQDLAADTGSSRGFSRRNLFYMRRFAALWPQREKMQPLAALIGWTHHQVLIDAFDGDPARYLWYVEQAARTAGRGVSSRVRSTCVCTSARGRP